MKLYLIFFVLFSSYFSLLNCQIENISPNTIIDITKPVKDTIKPEIRIDSPVILAGYDKNIRDSVVTIAGMVSDNIMKGLVLYCNGKKIPLINKNKFEYTLELKRGRNNVTLKAIDRGQNYIEKNLVFWQNPNADIDGPSIAFDKTSRGILNVTDTLNFSLEGSLKDESAISKLFINGKEVTVDDNLKFRFEPEIIPQDKITLRAIDVWGNFNDKELYINIDSSKQPDFDFGKYYAIIFTAGNYASPYRPDLNNPIPDGKNLQKVLESKYNFEKTFLVVNPKNSTISKYFADINKMVQPKDNLLIFFAGHGEIDSAENMGYLLPVDAGSAEIKDNWFAFSDLQRKLNAIKAMRVLVITDACYSGKLLNTTRSSMPLPNGIKDAYKNKCRVAITSGAEVPVPDESVFIRYLIEILDKNSEQFLTSRDLHYLVSKSVEANSEVYPKYGSIQYSGDTQLGDFVFIKKRR